MRRIATIAVALAAVAALIALLSGGSGRTSSTVRFDVIFDDARGLVSGQLVKIAGARAGTIDNVALTSGFKARIEASIDRRFMPFHANATCTICRPGTCTCHATVPLSGAPSASVEKTCCGGVTRGAGVGAGGATRAHPRALS